jgi:hypothetical protein
MSSPFNSFSESLSLLKNSSIYFIETNSSILCLEGSKEFILISFINIPI